MVSTILTAVVIGAIIGALARLILPGRQSISILMTILLGILGSLAGSWITRQVGYNNEAGIAWIPVIVGVVVAAGLILAYGAMTGRREIR